MQDLDNNVQKLLQKDTTNKYDTVKEVFKNILFFNYAHSDAQKILDKYGRKLCINAFIDNNINNIYNFFNRYLTKDEARQLLHEFFKTDIKLVSIYLDFILYHYDYSMMHIDKDTFALALEELKKHYTILEDIIFKFGFQALYKIENENRLYFIDHDVSSLHKIEPADTCFTYFPKQYLDEIWQLYGKMLLQRARRGPKLMLILFFLYESKFTREMFDILIARMKGYKSFFYINYILQCSTFLPEDKKIKLEALRLALKI